MTLSWLEHDSGNLCKCSLNLLFTFPLEIDNEGVIEPDNDDPQEMGDENVEVSTNPSMAVAAGKKGGEVWVESITIKGGGEISITC